MRRTILLCFVSILFLFSTSALADSSDCKPGCRACRDYSYCTDCFERYYLKYNDCLLCSKNCATCTSTTRCTSCMDGYDLNEYFYCQKSKKAEWSLLIVIVAILGLCLGIAAFKICKNLCFPPDPLDTIDPRRIRRRGDYVNGTFVPRDNIPNPSFMARSSDILPPNFDNSHNIPADRIIFNPPNYPALRVTPPDEHNPVTWYFNPQDEQCTPTITSSPKKASKQMQFLSPLDQGGNSNVVRGERPPV